MPATAELAPYRRLVELAESECACIAAGHVEELVPLQAEWDAIVAALAPVPPPAAEPLLRRALALAGQAERSIGVAQRALQVELGSVDKSRAVGRAYSPVSATGPTPSVDASA